MTKAIVTTVLCGMAAGYFFVPDPLVALCDPLITGGLCLILFLVGLDMGMQGESLWEDIKSVGFRIFYFPLAIITGTLVCGAAAGLFLPVLPQESLAVAAGFGWYSLAPMMLAEYSASISATAFLANVFREVFGIVLIPWVARHIGYVECIALPGAAAMDTCLPVVVSSTHDRIAVYSIVSGVVLSMTVPFAIETIMDILL